MSQINESAIKTPGVYINEIPLFPPSVAQVETAVVADQNRALAAVGFQRLADATEDVGQCRLFADSHAQRVIQLDAGQQQPQRKNRAADATASERKKPAAKPVFLKRTNQGAGKATSARSKRDN